MTGIARAAFSELKYVTNVLQCVRTLSEALDIDVEHIH